MRADFCRIPVMLCAGLALAVPCLAQDEATPSTPDSCAPQSTTIPFAAASPRNWNTWVSSTDLKDRYCNNVAIVELRSRAKKNAQGEIDVTFKVTTYTKPGKDKKAKVTIEVLATDRVLKSTTVEAIDAEEKKNGHGSGYLSLPVDLIPSEADPRLRVLLEAVDD